MHPHENNVAYIDGANLHKRIEQLGWEKEKAPGGDQPPQGSFS
jgi:hypothetical protein